VIRTVIVCIAMVIGWGFALQSALYAACFYLWIAYFRPESWAWNDIFTTLNLSYFAGVYLVVRAISSGVAFRLDTRTILLVLFLGHSFVSAWLGLNPDHSLDYWQEFAKVIVVSIVLTNVIQTAADLRVILIVIALSLGFEAVKQGWAQLILNPGQRNDNWVPFLGDNNLVAVGMAMLLPLIGALGATSTGWRKRAFQFMSIGVLYRGLSTYSRGGFLSLGAVSAIWFWRSDHKLKTLAAVTIAALLILPVLPQQFWDRMSTITAPAGQRDDSQQGRLHFWQVAIVMANERPLIGVGHRGYEPAYNSYDFSDGQYFSDRAVHSAWFGVLGELGYPGLLLFVAIIVSSLVTCRRVRLAARRGDIPGPLGPYAIALESSLIAFMVGGSFVSFQYCEMLWHFFALTVALDRVAVAEAAANRVRRDSEQRAAIDAPPAADPDRDFAWA
jgi:putative inorganic carbon (HCO3(-)) transporter